jgi:hypothetical protein
LRGANGLLSNPPTNYIYMREAKVKFYKGGVVPVAITPGDVNVEVIRKGPDARRDRAAESQKCSNWLKILNLQRGRVGTANMGTRLLVIPTVTRSTNIL